MVSFLVRLALFFLLIYLVRIGLRNFFRNLSSPRSAGDSQPREIRGVMMKDPVCGTFVDVQIALTSRIDGQNFYFCSEDCRRKFSDAKSAKFTKFSKVK